MSRAESHPNSQNVSKSKKPNLVLFGMPGSGKSTIGHELADKTGMHFIDADEYLVNRVGETIDKIVEKHGWDYFRKLESRTLLTLSGFENTVIATGGGAVLNPENSARLLQNGVSVLVEAPINELVERSETKKNPNRPPMQANQSVLEDYTDRWETRKELYAGASDFKVLNSGDDPTPVVDLLVEEVRNGSIKDRMLTFKS